MALVIGSIATSATALTYTQLPSVACSTCTVCNQGTAAMGIGLSASPTTNIVVIPPNGGQFLFVIANTNVLWVTNLTGSSTQEMSYVTQ